MVRYLFYTIGDLTYQSPLVHAFVFPQACNMWLYTDSLNTSEEAPICDLHVLRKILLRDAQIPGVRSPTRHPLNIVASNIGGPTVRNSGHVTYMAPGILRRLLGFRWNLCTTNFAESKAGVEALLNELDTLETFVTQNIRKQGKWTKWQGSQPVGVRQKSDAGEIGTSRLRRIRVFYLPTDAQESHFNP